MIRKFTKEAYCVIEYTIEQEMRENITVEDMLKQYLDSLKPKKGCENGKRKKTTIERYFRMYFNHVKGTDFGQMRLVKVKKYHCDDYIEYLYGKHIGKSYITQIKSLLKRTFDYAISREIIDKNFMTTVEINLLLCSAERKRVNGVWEDEEIKALCKASDTYWEKKQYRYSALIPILLFLGCRIGEISALTWDDVDFENGIITFNKTVIEYTDYDTHKKRREISSPKTEDSARRVKLNKYAAVWLRELKSRNEELGIISNYVVVTKNGKIPKEAQLAVSFQRFCKAAGVQYKSSHTCRRTYATTMIDGGIPIRQVSNDMGHKKVSTTLDGYYKAKKETDEITEKKEAVFRELYGNIEEVENLATPGKTPNIP